MRITHKLNHWLSKEMDDSQSSNRFPSIFMLSRKGNYFALSADPSRQLSNFFGWLNFFELGENSYTLYKTVEDIYLSDDQGQALKPMEIINGFSYFERIYSSASEKFVITKNGLIYEADAIHANVNILLDFRKILDYSDKGRIYRISREKLMDFDQFEKHRKDFQEHGRHDNNVLMIEYSKYADDGLKTLEKRFYLAIHGLGEDYELPDKWMKRHYEYDASRFSRAEFYVFHALKFLCKKKTCLIMASAENKEHAKGKIFDIMMNIDMMENIQENYSEKTLEHKYRISELSDERVGFGYVNAVHAMNGLEMTLLLNHRKLHGVWAGLPWFFQFWARDELVSLKALMLEKKHESVKEILFRNLNNTLSDGRILNIFPGGGLGSADGVGWLFKRINDFIDYTENNNIFTDYFSLSDLKYIKERLNFCIKQILRDYSKEGLISNRALETWMDTSFKESGYETDVREGMRIEIQALFLGMLKLMTKLDEMFANKFVKKSNKLVNVTETDLDYEKLERVLRDLVRERFLVKSKEGKALLNDGFDSSYSDVIRPNIFLAYYIYPELLSESEWENVFDAALERLWNDWTLRAEKIGGLSTIDKNHVLFQPFYTGENNKSYHRGDSWFYINNIAAISMLRLNKDKYIDFITKLLNASNEDMLFSGFIGYSSELSSGSIYAPGGCLCQTWSIATYIELVHEMYM
jgi:glycogen debranching enzyme